LTDQTQWSIADGGLFVRPETMDVDVIGEREAYLALEPRADDVLLDLGANIGAVSAAFLDAGVERVVAVEPEADNLTLLTANLSRYAPRVTLVRGIVAQTDGHRDLWLSTTPNRGMHSVLFARSSSTQQVPAYGLAGLLRQHAPTLVKIDIEGAEYELIEPLSALGAGIRGIAMELHFERRPALVSTARELVAAIEAQGFEAVVEPTLDHGLIGTIGIWTRP
jgi:FkbM family methyltransferase